MIYADGSSAIISRDVFFESTENLSLSVSALTYPNVSIEPLTATDAVVVDSDLPSSVTFVSVQAGSEAGERPAIFAVALSQPNQTGRALHFKLSVHADSFATWAMILWLLLIR